MSQQYTLVEDRIWVKKFWQDNHARGKSWQVIFQTASGQDYCRSTIKQRTHPNLEDITAWARVAMAGHPAIATARIECWG